MPLTAEQRAARDTKKALQKLSDVVLVALSKIDQVMAEPASLERDKRFAAIANWLDMQNDAARYFSLDVDRTRDDKKKAVAAAQKRLG
jgi:hypothetical protein